MPGNPTRISSSVGHCLAGEGRAPGTPFHVVTKAPFRGPIRLEISGRELLLGTEIASRLYSKLFA
ncbi:MAG: ferrous iron transport protein A [Anaerolineales bacterium]